MPPTQQRYRPKPAPRPTSPSPRGIACRSPFPENRNFDSGFLVRYKCSVAHRTSEDVPPKSWSGTKLLEVDSSRNSLAYADGCRMVRCVTSTWDLLQFVAGR